ncbi:MAG TPA: DedA family protein [Firmicutes bacterium]|nr:DedA family protein [Bacillota bacterium]
MSVFEQITQWCTHVIEVGGYPVLFGLMALESMIAPIPSEAVMPFAGFLAYEGKMSMWLIMVSATIGSIVGSTLSYWMGLYGGRPLVLKVGKYLFLNVHHLDATERFFNKYGTWTVFICRFIPVVRHFISIPAGMGRMPTGVFLIYTAIGATMWNMFLAWAGFKLKENWESLRDYFHYVDMVILVAAIVFIVGYIIGQIKHHRDEKLRQVPDDIDSRNNNGK